MRYAALTALPLALLFASFAEAEHLVPIGSSVASEVRHEVYSPVESETSVISLDPVDASYYANTPPSLEASTTYVTSPACGSGTCGSGACGGSPCGCNPCGTTTVYSSCAAYGGTTCYQPVVSCQPVAVDTGYRVGRGVLGQPKLYVSGQPLRNTLRFFTP